MTVPLSKSDRSSLEKLVEIAIKAVIDKNPKRPAELRGLAPDKVKHERDVETMGWLMSKMHLPTIDQHILELPHVITAKALWFRENVNGVLEGNSLFNLYDEMLSAEVNRFHAAWNEALAHDNEYRNSPNGELHIFSSPGDFPLTPSCQIAWDKIAEASNVMRKSLDKILQRIRLSYLEINLQDTNKRAWVDYVSFHKEFEEQNPYLSGTNKAKKVKKPAKK